MSITVGQTLKSRTGAILRAHGTNLVRKMASSQTYALAVADGPRADEVTIVLLSVDAREPVRFELSLPLNELVENTMRYFIKRAKEGWVA